MDDKGNIGEKFVNELAYNSFLKYWCYHSPKYENGDKKEICDLLIKFNSILILISVKNYEFKGNHFRYFNNTIKKAVKQLHGASKTLLGPFEVHIKHPEKDLEIFPKEQIQKVFRIVVNLGEGVKFYPFNTTTKNEEYVTLFDRDSFETIIKELDTLPDFIEYLQKRELLFKNKEIIVLPGEEFDFPLETQKEFFQLQQSINPSFVFISGSEKDLLSYYFKNKRNFPESFNDKSDGFYLIIDKAWDEFKATKKAKNKAKADKVSYFIDEFVKNELFVNTTPLREKLAIALLSFDRLTRRNISKNYFDFHSTYKDMEGLFFGRRFADFAGVGVLLTFYTKEMDINMINKLNNLAIESSHLFSDYKSKSMILISSNRNHRFMFQYIEKLDKYPEELEDQIRKEVETLGWFTQHSFIRSLEKEFPE